MINNVNLIGRITKDLELKRNDKGTAFCSFTLAVSSKRKNDNGEYLVNFIPCNAAGKTAEVLEKYCKKGSQIGVEGSLEVRTYQKKDGSNATSTFVMIRDFEFCDTKKTKEAASEENKSENYSDNYEISEEELPF